MKICAERSRDQAASRWRRILPPLEPTHPSVPSLGDCAPVSRQRHRCGLAGNLSKVTFYFHKKRSRLAIGDRPSPFLDEQVWASRKKIRPRTRLRKNCKRRPPWQRMRNSTANDATRRRVTGVVPASGSNPARHEDKWGRWTWSVSGQVHCLEHKVVSWLFVGV